MSVSLEPRQVEAIEIFVEPTDAIERKRRVEIARPGIDDESFLLSRERAR